MKTQAETLLKVNELQNQINDAVNEQYYLLDDVLAEDMKTNNLSEEQTIFWIDSLPCGCAYKIELMKYYRRNLSKSNPAQDQNPALAECRPNRGKNQ